MKPIEIPEKTLTLAENQDEYLNLDIVVMASEDGSPTMCSRWMPTPEELEALNAGCPIQLAIVGTSHPPVIVGVYADPAILGADPADTRPVNCRFRLKEEGKPYPKSRCFACGKNVNKYKTCKLLED